MSSGVPINSSRRTATYLAAELDDDDGVKVGFATATSETVLGAADYNGAQVANSGASWAKLPRTITITRSSSSGAYTTDDIVLVGKRGGTEVTETLTPASANGGDQLRGVQAFDVPPAITIPAQASTAGQFQIGCGNICAPAGDRFHGVTIRDPAGGQLNVQYGEETDAPTDSFAANGLVQEAIAPTRILTSDALSTPTTVDLTVALA